MTHKVEMSDRLKLLVDRPGMGQKHDINDQARPDRNLIYKSDGKFSDYYYELSYSFGKGGPKDDDL